LRAVTKERIAELGSFDKGAVERTAKEYTENNMMNMPSDYAGLVFMLGLACAIIILGVLILAVNP
jgi:hypothetical protein